MKKGLEACKRKTCTKIRSSIRESPQAQFVRLGRSAEPGGTFLGNFVANFVGNFVEAEFGLNSP